MHKGKTRIEEFLRKSPNGYYVLVVDENEFNTIRRLLIKYDVIIEELGAQKYMIKVKSRKVYIKMLRKLRGDL